MLLDEQEAFDSVEALASLIVGIQSTSARIVALAALERTDGQVHHDSSLADALLGFVALARTLRANCVRPASIALEDSANRAGAHADQYRDLLR